MKNKYKKNYAIESTIKMAAHVTIKPLTNG